MSDLISAMEQVKKIKNVVGLQSLLDEAYKILGNPMIVFNTEYNLLAHTKIATDDPFWNEIIANGKFSEEMREFLEEEGIIEDVANAQKITFVTTDKLKYPRMLGKIFNKNNSYVSNLDIMAYNRPFDENDPIVFEAICKLITREISSSEVYQEYEQNHQEAVIKKLIDKNRETKLDAAQIEIIYSSLKANLYIAAVDVSQCVTEHADTAYFRDLLRQAQPAYKYAVYSDYIIIIISTDDDALNVCRAMSELKEVFEQNNMYCGISGKFENLLELRRHYDEALAALQCVSDTRSSQRVFPCDPGSIAKIERIKKLKNGEGIQYFLNIGPEIFGNPLLFHDMELNLLGYTENFEITDPIWEELIAYGTSSDETINLFRTEGFIHTMESTKGGALLASEKIKYDRISWRIYSNDNIMIGCLSIVNTAKQFTEDELVLFGTFSRLFSKEVRKIEFYNNYGQVYSDTVINRLISGKIDDYTFYSEDIGNLYDNLMENLYLIVVDTTKSKAEHTNLTCLRNLFNWPGAVNRYAIYGDYIVIIISVDIVPLCEKNEFQELSKVFLQHNIYAGVSSCFDNIYELPGHYVEAVSAVSAGAESSAHSERRIFLYSK